MPLIPLGVFLSGNPRDCGIELQLAPPFERVGVHASACQVQRNQVHGPIIFLESACGRTGLIVRCERSTTRQSRGSLDDSPVLRPGRPRSYRRLSPPWELTRPRRASLMRRKPRKLTISTHLFTELPARKHRPTECLTPSGFSPISIGSQ